MGSLFTRLFLWFWLVMIVIATAFVVTQRYWDLDDGLPGAGAMEDYAAEVSRLRQEDGRGAVAGYLRALSRETEVRFLILRSDGRPQMGRAAPGDLQRLLQSDTGLMDNQPRRHGRLRFRAIELMPAATADSTTTGSVLVAAVPIRGFRELPIWLRLALALVITAGLSALLAARLSAPLRRIRTASRQLADGDLGARVPEPGRGRDEITMLGRDFNTMAGRLESLVGSRIRLLHDVSHELRSPLARLQVALELTRRNNASGHGSADTEATLDRMDLEIQRLDALITQVLGLARLESGAVVLHREAVSLAGLVAEVCDDASFEAEADAARLITHDVPGVMVQADRSLLRSALDNVVRNALRHSPAGGTVNVGASVQGPWLTLSVDDSGPGVPEEQLEHIFEPFVRVSEARERESGGHGLGLAIVRRAMEAHGGRASASNRPEGGLRVNLWLPTPRH